MFEIEEITREGSQVIVRVNIGTDTDKPIFPFKFIAGNPEAAELLKRHLDRSFAHALRVIRKEAYDAGWHDKASKKTRKQKEFYGDWEPDCV